MRLSFLLIKNYPRFGWAIKSICLHDSTLLSIKVFWSNMKTVSLSILIKISLPNSKVWVLRHYVRRESRSIRFES